MLQKKSMVIWILLLGIMGKGFSQEVWMLTQEFVKFGKKDGYEEWKKQWMSKWGAYNNREFPSIALEDQENSQYMYLIPLGDYAALDRLSEQMKNFSAFLDPLLRKTYSLAASSTLNFRISTLHHYLSECSYIPRGKDCSISQMPFVKYVLYSIIPGNEETFEHFLEKTAAEYSGRNSSHCWRTWKIVFGGDVPKYAVAFFAEDESTLRDKMNLLDGKIREIVTREKEGQARLRKDLSLFE